MTIIPSSVVCPRCFSKDLYRFGKDKEGFQKYQCKRCKRQFAPDNPPSNSRTKNQRKYPDCPVCGKAPSFTMIILITQTSVAVTKNATILFEYQN